MSLRPIKVNTLHVVIDMQRMFAEETAWHTPVVAEILPNVISLCDMFSTKTVFAKFMLPKSADRATGQWKRYYQKWSTMPLDVTPASMLDLINPLLAYASPSNQFEKTAYSIFSVPEFGAYLAERGIDTLIFSGVETDVCVYASVLDAVDLGLRVVIAADAVGSSDVAAHDAVLLNLAPRLLEQIDIVTTQMISEAWTPNGEQP